MLPIKRESYFYDVYPRVVLTERETKITIRPIDAHVAFSSDAVYTIRVIPLTADIYSRSKPVFYETQALPKDGAIEFCCAFCGEQEHSIRIFKDGSETLLLKTSVYSVYSDLYMRTPLLGDFHVHTCYSDGVESPEFVAAMYRQAGFDFISITDHGRMDASRRAISFYKGVPLDFRLYPGEEVHSPHNHVHIVHFGGECSVNEQCLTEIAKNPWENPGKEEWNRETEALAQTFSDLPEGVDPFIHASCLRVIERIHEAKGMAILCHPFWLADVHNVTDSMTRMYLENHYADAFELIGGQTNHENMLQIALYQQLLSEGCRIPVVGNSDSHGTVDRVYFDGMKTIVFAKENAKDDIIEAVRHEYSVAMDEYPGEEPRFYAAFRMVRYALFLYEHYFPLHAELCFEEGRLMRALVAGDSDAAARLAACSGQTGRFAAHFFGRDMK